MKSHSDRATGGTPGPAAVFGATRPAPAPGGRARGRGEPTTASADPQMHDRRAMRHLTGLRRAIFGILITLIVQYGLGIGVNLYVSLPAAGRAGRGMGQAFSNGPVLAVHAVLGLLLLASAIAVLTRAITVRRMPVVVISAIGLLAILGAAAAGSSFVSTGKAAASMAMALATGVALLCYVIALYTVRPAAVSFPGDPDRTGRPAGIAADPAC